MQHNADAADTGGADVIRASCISGSNGFKALAREAALKLLELTDGQVIAAFDSPLGFRHGPKTIVTRDTLLFVFISNDPYTRRYDLDLLCELRSDARGGPGHRRHRPGARCGHAGRAPARAGSSLDAGDGDLYFPYIVCAQLYAFHRSLSLGNKPDQPSNSGTVNRVVRGVTIHSL